MIPTEAEVPESGQFRACGLGRRTVLSRVGLRAEGPPWAASVDRGPGPGSPPPPHSRPLGDLKKIGGGKGSSCKVSAQPM